MKLARRLLCIALVTVALQAPAITAHARAAAPCAITTKSEQIAKGTIVYNTAWAGPTLLLLHGLFAAKEQWNSLACLLAASGFTALAVDLPGYGKSTAFALPDYRARASGRAAA